MAPPPWQPGLLTSHGSLLAICTRVAQRPTTHCRGGPWPARHFAPSSATPEPHSVSTSRHPLHMVPRRRRRRNHVRLVARGAADLAFSACVAWWLRGLPLRPDTRSCSATACAFRWSPRWRLDRHRLLPEFRRGPVGLCVGAGPHARIHAAHEDCSSPGRCEPSHHGCRTRGVSCPVERCSCGRARPGGDGICLEPHVARTRPLSACLARAIAAVHSLGRLERLVVACNGRFGSACRAGDAHGGVANARDAYGHRCALRLALRAACAVFTPESTVTGH